MSNVMTGAVQPGASAPEPLKHRGPHTPFGALRERSVAE